MFSDLQHYYTPLDPNDEPDSANRLQILKAYRTRGPLPSRATIGLPARALKIAAEASAMAHNILSQPDMHFMQGSVGASSSRNEGYTDHRQSHAPIAALEHPPIGTREIFQSITCLLGTRDKSFEELRLECYLQSRVATGQPPKPVDQTISWWNVIPPAFEPFVQETTPPPDVPGPSSEIEETKVVVDAIMSAEHLMTLSVVTADPLIAQPA